MTAWQFNGCAPRGDVIRWCTRNIEVENWTHDFETIYFRHARDYTWFILHFSK